MGTVRFGGVTMASVYGFRIAVTGKGGHGSTPENCVDPIVAAIKLHEALETLMSREKSPVAEAVLTLGKFQAGDAANVIPEQAGKSACCQETFSASSAVAPGERGVPDEVSGGQWPVRPPYPARALQ